MSRSPIGSPRSDRSERLLGSFTGDELRADEASGGPDSSFMPLCCAGLSGLGAFMFGYTLGFTSPGAPAMMGHVFKIDACVGKGQLLAQSEQADLFGSLVNLGCMAGAILCGFLMEKLGRKYTIMLAAWPFAGAYVWMYFSTSFLPILIARLITGVAVGIVSVAVPTYISETAPSRLRGSLGAVNQFAIVTGIFFVYLLGVVLPTQSNKVFDPSGKGKTWCDPDEVTLQDQWRNLCVVGAVVSGVLFFAVCPLPRSPAWLVSKGKVAEAQESLKRLRGSRYDPTIELLTLVDDKENDESPAGLRDLFTPALRWPLFLIIGVMFAQQFSGINAVIFYTDAIFHDAGSTNNNLSGMIVMGVQIVMTGVAVALIERAGRKVLMLVSTAGMCIFSFTLGLFFYLNRAADDGGVQQSWLAIASLIGYITFFALGMGAIPWVLMGELFPTRVRSITSSVATAFNWLSGFTITLMFPKLKSWLTEEGAFWLFSGILFFSFLFIKVFIFETKGKSFQEIQMLLRK